jgi:uncharacterized membrane protein
MFRDIFSKREMSLTVLIAVAGVMAALVCVGTMLIQIPVPSTEGFINIGDAMIFISSLLFGRVIGGFAGGVGSALADIILGYGYFAPLTFIVKGLEGVLVGTISNGKNRNRDLLAVIVGGIVMVLGYFLGEAFPMAYGIPAALTEVPGNIFQVTIGGLIAIPLALVIRRYLSVPRW